MAKSENNEVMYGARGKVGNLLVFKNFGDGKTIISKIPRRKDNPVYSETQQIAKERFKEGVMYARGASLDPILSAFYKPFTKPGASVYNMALADFCKLPEIKSISTEHYQGNVGGYITIKAIDSFKIVTVRVLISKPDGVLIETGIAEHVPNSLNWMYTSEVANQDLLGTVVKVQVFDTPGNLSELTTTISL
ncbi:MAG: hypothetical protein V4663_17315 [Bacteroidota bacterium]